YMISQGLALHLVAALSSWLAQEIRRTHVLYSEILEKMAEGVVATDAEGKILFVNSEALELLQYGRADNLVGRKLWEVFRRQGDRARGAEPARLDPRLRPGARALEVPRRGRAAAREDRLPRVGPARLDHRRVPPVRAHEAARAHRPRAREPPPRGGAPPAQP